MAEHGMVEVPYTAVLLNEIRRLSTGIVSGS